MFSIYYNVTIGVHRTPYLASILELEKQSFPFGHFNRHSIGESMHRPQNKPMRQFDQARSCFRTRRKPREKYQSAKKAEGIRLRLDSDRD